MSLVTLTTPLGPESAAALRAGDAVSLSGVIHTARDTAHRRLVELLDAGEPLPFDPIGSVIYYCGPSPAAPGRIIGASGPTTAYRMDAFAPRLYEAGVVATIGKGKRSAEVKAAIVRTGSVYLAALGGAGALLSLTVKDMAVIAWPELGPEAIHRLVVENFPAVVAVDAAGRDLYDEGVAAYARA
ncbi:MAG: FumA C-terminus/TtdB family hydratase beta subunit [Proteobacteria bacterium]|nr:FumA C-terminus/TtdB family hydratase beta subunit [Pseudomonadota bacterium]MBU1741708.1 FumA C-terminus/TtdB family hydratase beta subunit [Pseudomonadota bacterium]